jgi:hypothetical protein
MRQQRSLSADIRFRMAKRFAALLGWHPLGRLQHTPTHLAISGQSNAIIWYEAGQLGSPRTDCFFQLNELEVGKKSVLFSGCVYAVRFRICTGWHIVGPLRNDSDIVAHASKWQQWFARQMFSSLRERQRFRKQHPECLGYSWPTIRRIGPPYTVEFVRRRGTMVTTQVASENCRRILKHHGETS